MRTLRGLYVIADSGYIGNGRMLETVAEVLTAGVKIIQFRDKTSDYNHRYALARELKSLTETHQSLLIVNDDVLLSRSIDADGVHLGREDCPIAEARQILGAHKIIGASCYNHFDSALQAAQAGASYVAFGSFSRSPTKPDAARASIELMSRAKQELKVPICAIGGITKNNVLPLLDTGVDMIAVLSAICTASSPRQAAQEYLALCGQVAVTRVLQVI